MRKLLISTSILVITGAIWALIIASAPDSTAEIQGVGNGINGLFATRTFLFFFPILVILLGLNFFFTQLKETEDDQKFKKLFTENRIALEGLEAITKNLIELRHMGYTSQFFNHLPIIYQDFYETLRRIIRRAAILPELPSIDSRPETQDLWVLCRSFLRAIEKNPSIYEEIRRNFKKNQTLSQEMSLFTIRFDRFLKALQSYDRDQFIIQFMEEGSLGRVYDILMKAFNEAHEQEVKEETLADKIKAQAAAKQSQSTVKIEHTEEIKETVVIKEEGIDETDFINTSNIEEKILPLKAENIEQISNEELMNNLKTKTVGENPFLNNLSPGEPTLFDKKK